MPNSSPNHLNSAPNTDNNQNEILSDKQHLTRLQNEIGSKVLTLVGFESRNKDIVNSSFEKARKQKEKLPGKNNERRNFAYLSRLNNMVEKHGDALERKLWEASAENVVMDYEDIPDAYWKQQEQILRDNGQGRELTSNEKEYLTEDIINKQRESINTWSNYLGDKDCPYPTWFKVYAFDGVSKMGLINKETKEFEKRDKSTVASFPTLNPEVLAKVYRNINEFYAVDKKAWLAQHPDDAKLESLVKSGNFPKLYAKELFETKTIIKTPEKPEDIEGDWFTYQLGDEDELAKTAEGTGWCIADPNVAHNYLSYGNYAGNNNDWEEDDEDWEDEEEEGENNDWKEDDDNPEEDNQNSSKAKFIIFRLKAPNSPDGYSTNGVASIRLDPDGKVAEVSGLDGGQALEDSLVQTVKEKVLSLPGGKEFLQKFEDKQTLIKLDHKLQNGEDLTKEELSFLYELDRPIATLDTYNSEDPRITELKEKYDLEYALEKGVDVNKLVSSLDPDDITENLNILLEHGADINNVVGKMDHYGIADNLDYLLNHGAEVNNVVKNLSSYYIVNNLDTLFKHGADINNIVNNMDSEDITKYLKSLLEYDADINNIMNKLELSQIVNNLDSLLENGADVNNIINKLKSYNIGDNLFTLLEHGADINNIVNKLESWQITKNLDTLLRHGADINVNELISDLKPYDIAYNLDTLLDHGADVNNIVNNMNSKNIAKNLYYFLRYYGADVNNVVRNLDKEDIKDNIGLLRKYGANLDAYQENN